MCSLKFLDFVNFPKQVPRERIVSDGRDMLALMRDSDT
jgi:hypothetical protein